MKRRARTGQPKPGRVVYREQHETAMERAVLRAMAEMVRERMTWYSTDTHIPVAEKIQCARVFQSHSNVAHELLFSSHSILTKVFSFLCHSLSRRELDSGKLGRGRSRWQRCSSRRPWGCRCRWRDMWMWSLMCFHRCNCGQGNNLTSRARPWSWRLAAPPGPNADVEDLLLFLCLCAVQNEVICNTHHRGIE